MRNESDSLIIRRSLCASQVSQIVVVCGRSRESRAKLSVSLRRIARKGQNDDIVLTFAWGFGLFEICGRSKLQSQWQNVLSVTEARSN
jgi:hypothetical protein